jgi:succinate dehydrogenase/fumarate reductase flavoprotein subunit
MEIAQKAIDRAEAAEAALAECKQENAELTARFDDHWNVVQRAINLWQDRNPGNERMWPDHARLTCWLMETLEFEQARTGYLSTGLEERNKALAECKEKVVELRERAKTLKIDDQGSIFNTDLTSAIELNSLLECADCLVTSALARKESRGAHSRLDYTERDDDAWLKHTLNWNDNGEVRLDYKPVTITKHQPLARSY